VVFGYNAVCAYRVDGLKREFIRLTISSSIVEVSLSYKLQRLWRSTMNENQTKLSQREIKFRAWDVPNKEMRYSNKHDGEFYINTKGVMYMYKIPNSTKYYKNYAPMQCTEQEDKNGVEIYEGDIVKLNTLIDKKERGSFWEDMLFEVKFERQSFIPSRLIESEVVGNIYENPELLKA